jgi:hypothetical protein
VRDENRSDMDGSFILYLFLYFYSESIQIRIVLNLSDMIRLNIDIINMRFEYSDTVTVSDVKYLDSDTDMSQLL